MTSGEWGERPGRCRALPCALTLVLNTGSLHIFTLAHLHTRQLRCKCANVKVCKRSRASCQYQLARPGCAGCQKESGGLREGRASSRPPCARCGKVAFASGREEEREIWSFVVNSDWFKAPLTFRRPGRCRALPCAPTLVLNTGSLHIFTLAHLHTRQLRCKCANVKVCKRSRASCQYQLLSPGSRRQAGRVSTQRRREAEERREF